MTPASPRELSGGELGPANREGSKLAALTARRIEDEIIARKWPIGEVIGSEADLMARYEVSRAVLREAVRLVEHHGAARMRRGPSGGLVVQAPDVAAAVAAVVLYLEQADTSVDDLLYARRILEPVAASLASERISEAGIERLRGVLAAEASLTTQQRLATEHNVSTSPAPSSAATPPLPCSLRSSPS
jgi:DNA-binding FadR family transcriptional regulator